MESEHNTTRVSLVFTEDQSHTLYSEKFEAHYHSVHGAIQESRHVFLEAALLEKAKQKTHISVLEIGFGTGLNALLTYLEAERASLQIDYTSAEAYPLPIATAEQLNYPSLLQAPKAREVLLQMHKCSADQPQLLSDYFTFTKWLCRFESLPLHRSFDLIYFDAFAPNAQPELWEPSFLQLMYDLLLPEGLLTTYCAQGAFKRHLKSIGFVVEALPGPPGKREMTRARK